MKRLSVGRRSKAGERKQFTGLQKRRKKAAGMKNLIRKSYSTYLCCGKDAQICLKAELVILGETISGMNVALVKQTVIYC